MSALRLFVIPHYSETQPPVADAFPTRSSQRTECIVCLAYTDATFKPPLAWLSRSRTGVKAHYVILRGQSSSAKRASAATLERNAGFHDDQLIPSCTNS